MLYKDFYIALLKLKKYLKFFISGSLAALVNLGMLYVFHGVLEIPVVLAASLSFVLAFVVSFTLQKFWTFADMGSERIYGQLSRYLLVGLFGLWLNAFGIHILTERFGVFYLLAEVFLTIVLAIFNYFLYRLIFRKDDEGEKEMQARKSILIATGIYPPDTGGPASYSHSILGELRARGFSVRLITYGKSEPGDSETGVVRISRKSGVFGRYWCYFQAVWRLAKDVDLVYVQGPVSEGLPAYVACRLRGKRYLLKVVGDFAWEQASQRAGVTDQLDLFQKKNYGLRTEIWRLVQIFVAHGAERVIVPSYYLSSIVSGWGVAEERIRVIYNAVNVGSIAMDKEAARAKLNLSGQVLVSASRLVPWKGFISLVRVMADPELKATLYIAGDGPEKEAIAMEIERLGLGEKVKMLGALEQSELWSFIRAADAFILNTAYEGLSHLLIEAMSLATPIITTAVGGNTELIENGKSGHLIPFSDDEALKVAIKSVLSDPAEASRRADVAKGKVLEFSQERMIEELVKEISLI